MSRKLRTILLIAALSLAAMSAAAGGVDSTDTKIAAPVAADTLAGELPAVRPVASAYTASFGSAHIRDTYLTPLPYSGWNLSLRYERLQAMRFDPQRWVMKLQGRVGGGLNYNKVHNSVLDHLDGDISWAMMRRWRLAPGLQVCAGGSTVAEAGVLYMARNGNNPISAKAAWTVGAEASASYRLNLLRRLPITLRYAASMPLTGVFFSPGYGELYYEIYLGNHSGLVHAVWPGNFFRLDQMLTADLHMGHTNLRLGYSAGIFSSRANNITNRCVRHEFVVGFVSEWVSLRWGAPAVDKARIISATY